MEQQQTQQNQNLFYLMNRIDCQLQNQPQKAILFVGMSKAGKSTTFNWINHVPLKAIKQGGRGRKVCYQPIGQVNNVLAQVTGGCTSCTLVPNIVKYKNQLVIDTAGYEDKRNYIGTIGVAYSLKAIFQTIKQVKFIIVLSENAVYNNQTELFSTFNNFLTMFKINQISPQTKLQIFNSTSLLLTKCQSPENIKADIENCMKQLKNPQLDQPNKDLIWELLNHFLQKDKIVHFRMAQIDKNPQQPQAIQTLNQKQWHFFNIKQAKTIEAQPTTIVQLPFNVLFNKLDQAQKNKIKDSLSMRINSYKDFCNIIYEVIGLNIGIDKINYTNLQYESFGSRIDRFIQANDHYQSQKYINKKQISIIDCQPIKLNAFKLILELYQIITEHAATQANSNFMATMNKFRSVFIKLSTILMKMYGDRDLMAKNVLKLKYILLRGIRQFQMLFNISKYHVSEAAQKIQDSLQIIFPVSKEIIMENYIKSFKLDDSEKICFSICDFKETSKNKIQKYFLTKEEAVQFQIYFATYDKNNASPIIQFYPLMREIKLALSKYAFQDAKYNVASQYLLQAFQFQRKFQINLQTNFKTGNPNTAQNPTAPQILTAFTNKMKNHYLTRVIILNSLSETLVKVNKFQIAIEIAQFNRDIISSCKYYRELLNINDDNLQKRKEILRKFAEYSFNHGRWRGACDILEELFNCETISFESKLEINAKLIEYSENEAKSKELYVNHLKSYNVIGIDDARIGEIIGKIKTAVSK